MPIAGTNISLDSAEGMDRISQTEKITSPYFSDGTTTLAGSSIATSSLTDTNEKYFFGISNTSTLTTEEFNVAFGSLNGYGSLVETNTKAETEAIYKQYASMLLAPTEVAKDQEIFIMSARRSNMKDRVNKGTWTIALSGSNTAGTSTVANKIVLTDDSVNDNPTASPVGDRYNIVSGSAGTVAVASTVKNYGFFYPDMGILVLSQAELSASIPGKGANKADTVIHGSALHRGFVVSTDTNANEKTAMRLVNCLQPSDGLTFRDEEDQVSSQYFCRIRSGQMNFSNNPTFISGSLNELRQKTMKGNPTSFITGVQLYNNSGDLVAVGNLSTPLKTNFTSEATIKVKLTY